MTLLLLVLTACAGRSEDVKDNDDTAPDSADTTDTADTPDTTDTTDSGDDTATWLALPAGCVAPDALGLDPVSPVGRYDSRTDGLFVEIIDVDVRDGVAWTVGQGGLTVVDVSDPEAPTLVASENSDRWHKVEPLGGTYAAATHRDRGMTVLSVAEGRVSRGRTFSGIGEEGLLARDGRLYVTSRTEGIRVYDVSDPGAVEPVTTVPGLGNPWEISGGEGEHAWVADASLGVVPVDLSDPDAPVIGTPVPLPGASHALERDGWLYVAAGGEGVVVFDVFDPTRPIEVGRVDTGGSAIVLAEAGGVLWVAAHESFVALDLGDPSAPAPLGHQLASEYALAVGTDGRHGVVGNWTKLDVWAADRAAASPELDLDADRVTLPADGGAVELRLTNRGGGTLELVGAEPPDPRVAVSASSLVVAPGESALLRLSFAADGAPLSGDLCLATNDPDGPRLLLPLSAGDPEDPVGEPAPDFTLPDLEGGLHTLSEQRGHPVFITYFATW